jgi:hypothetical protein
MQLSMQKAGAAEQAGLTASGAAKSGQGAETRAGLERFLAGPKWAAGPALLVMLALSGLLWAGIIFAGLHVWHLFGHLA